MKNIAIVTVLILFLVACGTVQDMTQAVKDAGINPNLKTGNTSNRLIARGSCPQIEIIEDLGMISEFSNEKDPKPQNLVSNAQITNAQSTCSYGLKSVTVDLKVAFESTIGPQSPNTANNGYISYPFFVAVTSPGGKIIAKEVFTTSMTFGQGTHSQKSFEELRQIIPITNRYEGSRYKIMVGFQASKDQLEYNRDQIRAREAEEAALAEKARIEAQKAQEEAQKAAQAVIKAQTEALQTGAP